MDKHTEIILSELNETLRCINDNDLFNLVENLINAEYVVVVGVGRVLISLKAWVKRFNHLGIHMNYLGSETELPVSRKGLVLIASSSGESLVPLSIAKIAKKMCIPIAYIGCTPESHISKLSSFKVILKGRTKKAKEEEYESKQPMSTLFEQQLFLLGDIIALKIMELRDMSELDIKIHHANLE